MRAARVLIADPLNDREAALIEDVALPGEPRVQAERLAAAVAADLQHGRRRDAERGATAVIEGIGIGDQRAQPVVAAAQIEDDEVAARGALGASEIGEKRRRGESDGERRDAVLDEGASRDHMNWYSADPRMRCARPEAFVCICASDPVHDAPLLA